MRTRLDELRSAWEERGTRMGATKRAVLFKRLPGFLNDCIHRQHVSFVSTHCPQRGTVLDIGCGYGRIAQELKNVRPELQFQGIDICEPFVETYRRTVGPCFHGAVQDFPFEKRFDCVLIVTTLMYLSATEQAEVIERAWKSLATGGRLICIEPASEMFRLWRRLTGKASASPTGGSVAHFTQADLIYRIVGGHAARLIEARSIGLLNFWPHISVHHAVVASM